MNPPKNVVFIMCDSLQWHYMGCYGSTWCKTPNFDRLAREGVTFDNVYSEGLPTIPVRRALMTGRFTLPYRGWSPLELDDTTVADILWRHCTYSGLITDTAVMHLPKYGYQRGFDMVYNLRGHDDDNHYYAQDPLYHLKMDDYHKPAYRIDEDGNQVEEMWSLFSKDEMVGYLAQRQYWRSDEDQNVAHIARHSIRFLEEIDRNKPFFLWIDSFDPHEPWDAPSIYDPEKKCPYDPDYDGQEIWNPVSTYADNVYTDREMAHIRALYAEKVTNVDKYIGKVLDRIRTLGLEQSTMIVLMADHGEPLGNGTHGHGIVRKCRPWPYEELVHVPMIVKAPGLEAGKRVKGLVQNIDITPTMMEWLGVPQEAWPDMQGKSLWPLLKGEEEKVRDFVITGFFGQSWSIITEDWSYIHWLNPVALENSEAGGKTMFEVFDIQEGEVSEGVRDAQTMFDKIKNQQENQWTCVPGSLTEVPAVDGLYNRHKDPFQLENVIKENPEKARELYDKLREFMMELKAESIYTTV
jgi:arylsulfatase A-like enzyme